MNTHTSDDDEILRSANERLLARRAAGGIGTVPPRPVAPAVADVVRYAPRLAPVPAPRPTVAAHPKALGQIPPRFRAVTWATMESLVGPEGHPSLGEVTIARGSPLSGPGRGQAIREALAGAPSVVLLGASGAGKTLAGVCAFDAAVRSGEPRPRWIHARSLADAHVLALALSASLLVLDGVGDELDGAGTDSGLAAQRRVGVCDLVERWYLRGSGRLVVTTGHDYPACVLAYGGGTARRIYEGARVITFRCPS